MPNVENLKKQAKQLLQWHRTGHYPVAATLRCLPRFGDLTDPQILEQPFKLADAQLVVALEAGFPSWKELLRSAESDPEKPEKGEPRLLFVEPQLFTLDLAASLQYFVEKLGFEVAFTYGQPPFYGQVKREGVALNLRLTPVWPWDKGACEGENFLSASIVTSDPKALYLEFQERGADFAQKLKREPWGSRTFIVRDPDGNLILFA